MMLMIKTLMHVIFPGVAGFMISKALILPQLITWTAYLPGGALMCIVATGLLTFAMASVLRGWSIRLTRRLGPEPPTA